MDFKASECLQCPYEAGKYWRFAGGKTEVLRVL